MHILWKRTCKETSNDAPRSAVGHPDPRERSEIVFQSGRRASSRRNVYFFHYLVASEAECMLGICRPVQVGVCSCDCSSEFSRYRRAASKNGSNDTVPSV
jgi:hypothetical protein